MSRIQKLDQALQERILVLDGPAGTMIQQHKLSEADFRGDRFANWKLDVQGNNDLLNLIRPSVIRDMHQAYIEAGADILETNTFSSTSIAQADYAMERLAYELNYEGARIARDVVNEAEAQDGKERFVAGAIGPTNRTASISPDVNNPGARNVTFEELATAYREAAAGLIDGGSDLLLIETIFDTLNAKAALYGISELFDEREDVWPVVISATITDQSGRTLSGQTATAFYHSIRHCKPQAVGLNCALGPDLMRPYLAELSNIVESYVIVYPNAGLPNAFGEYDETPESMTEHVREWAESGMLNIIGGCCGSTPDHIRAFAEAVHGLKPRTPVEPDGAMKLSGLEPFILAS